MKVATVLEGKIVWFIGSAKIPERKGSISPSSFYGQLLVINDFSLIYPVDEFSFKGVKIRTPLVAASTFNLKSYLIRCFLI